MRIFCEVFIQDFLPAVRAMVARELTEKHKLKQTEAAEKMGCTQGAISQYKRELRGVKVKTLLKDKFIREEIEKYAAKLLAGEVTHKDEQHFCNLCKLISVSPAIRQAHEPIGELRETMK
ncbi:MAG TPA: helix-turn-helix domain-containing protein [archaeon]|nr:helix-turn-helix domain-containing protein [archaeon]